MKDGKNLIEKIEDKLTIRSKRAGYAGLGFLILLILTLNTLVSFRDPESMNALWSRNIGVNLLAGPFCAVIYYCCLQDSAGVGERNALFLSLLITSSIGIFLSACRWIVQGIPALVFWNRIVNVLLYFNNYMMLFMFWRCTLFMLEINDGLARVINEFLRISIIPVLILILSNLFVPALFNVDTDGISRITPLFPILLVLMVPLLFGICIGIITARSSTKDKIIVGTFIGFPLIVFLIGIFTDEISVLEASMFLSVAIIYLMLINERGKKLAVTQTELHMASEIQESMLPHVFPPFPDREEFELFASMDPAREIGGDFYDFFLIDDQHLAVLIADVSDKGVPAALFMMSSKIMINYRARQGGTPGEILTDVNAHIARDNKSGMFVTVWMGILDLETGALICCNAGHEYPAICGTDGVFRIFRDKHCLLVGAMEKAKYKDYEMKLSPGDKIFVYTDGVPEANNAAGDLYGMERLEAALNRTASESPEMILKNIRADIDTFVNGAKQFDDLTMFCLEYKGIPAHCDEDLIDQSSIL